MSDADEAAEPPTNAPRRRKSKRDSFAAFIEFLHTPSTKKGSSEVEVEEEEEEEDSHHENNNKSTQQYQQQIDDANTTTTNNNNNNNNLLSDSIATVQDISRLNRRFGFKFMNL